MNFFLISLELPLPKVYRIIRNYQSTFGITLRADSSTKRQIVDDIIKDSVAEFAGLLVGSQIVEVIIILNLFAYFLKYYPNSTGSE